MSAAPPPGTLLCRVDEIEDPGCKGFVFGEGARKFAMFLVRNGYDVWGYENSCPHLGVPLNWEEDEFLSQFGPEIVCATHGAMFRMEDGYCTQGPCSGESLTAIELTIRDGEVRVA